MQSRQMYQLIPDRNWNKRVYVGSLTNPELVSFRYDAIQSDPKY